MTVAAGTLPAVRLESLRNWGNLEVSASVGAVSTVADYYKRRNRYLITRVGQEVHELVENVLAQVDDVRDAKVPSFEHDGFDLYETGAIVRYVDRAFPGKALQPSDARHAARMDQIISIVDSYAYGAIVGQLVWQRLVVPMTGGQPDEAIVAASLPRVKLCLSEFERLAAGGQHLVAGGLSLADLYLAPVFAYLMGTPESGGLLADKPKLKAWWASYSQTAAMKGTEPQFG